jgi:BMFP domain-containing protein YqiC
MADLIDKAIEVGLEIEKKAKETLDGLKSSREAASKEKSESAPEGEGAEKETGLTSRQAVENRVVDEGTKILKEVFSAVNSLKERLGRELSAGSEKVADKLHVATDDELDVVKEMARVAREKVDTLEKRVVKLEAALKKKKG